MLTFYTITNKKLGRKSLSVLESVITDIVTYYSVNECQKFSYEEMAYITIIIKIICIGDLFLI